MSASNAKVPYCVTTARWADRHDRQSALPGHYCQKVNRRCFITHSMMLTNLEQLVWPTVCKGTEEAKSLKGIARDDTSHCMPHHTAFWNPVPIYGIEQELCIEWPHTAHRESELRVNENPKKWPMCPESKHGLLGTPTSQDTTDTHNLYWKTKKCAVHDNRCRNRCRSDRMKCKLDLMILSDSCMKSHHTMIYSMTR